MTVHRTLAVLAALLASLGAAVDAEAQIRLETAGMLLDHGNDSSTSLISGMGGISSADADFHYEPAIRLSGGFGMDGWEIDASYTIANRWDAQLSGFLDSPLIFDDNVDNMVIVPMPPANAFGFVNALFSASSGGVEASEAELLQEGASFLFDYQTNYQDYEINLGTGRGRSPLPLGPQMKLRAGVGYRNIQADEASNLYVIGTFDALDSDDAAVPGDATNDANDALSDAALTGAGLTLVSGAADGFDAAGVAGVGPDTLSMFFGGTATNSLNGAQLLLAIDFFSDERLKVETTAKFGLYHNQVTGTVRERYAGGGTDDSVYARALSDSQDVGAFVGGVGGVGIYAITEYLSVTAGYEVTVLSNVALSADQARGIGTTAAGTSTYSVVADGDIVIHGGQLGLRLVW
jgi:hypothetical protein